LIKEENLNMQLNIDERLARRLVAAQFPKWQDLPIRPVAVNGWDNRTFHLGDDMLIRMPSAEHYAVQVEKEQIWLPKIASSLPLAIPIPIAMGKPGEDYPWAWSIYRWLEGSTAASANIDDLSEIAKGLATFLNALHNIDTVDGPPPGLHSFHRGGLLETYDHETRHAIDFLRDKIDTQTAVALWEEALKTTWTKSPVWVHGDISPGNLLVNNGKLSAVIDFGQLTVGDPACDLAIAWTFFKGKSRKVFKTLLPLDAATWARGRAWTLWKALMTAAGSTNPNNFEAKNCWHIIDSVLTEHKEEII
jgi:aminoglycoside phosphotransferase (APT) family kinase protein